MIENGGQSRECKSGRLSTAGIPLQRVLIYSILILQVCLFQHSLPVDNMEKIRDDISSAPSQMRPNRRVVDTSHAQ